MDDLSKYMHVFFVSLLPLLMSFNFCRGALTVSTLVRNLTHFDLSEQSASTKRVTFFNSNILAMIKGVALRFLGKK